MPTGIVDEVETRATRSTPASGVLAVQARERAVDAPPSSRVPPHSFASRRRTPIPPRAEGLSDELEQLDRAQLVAEVRRARRAFAEATLDRQELTSAILDGIHASIVTTDDEGRVTFVNAAACATLDLSPEECLGADVMAVLQIPPSVQLPAGGESVKRLSYAYTRADGEEIQLGLSISRAAGAAPHRLGYFLMFRDIADARQQEMDVRRVERLAAMGSMVAGFAHEVRNPLASIRILAEALESEIDAADGRHEYVERLLHQIERVERLVKTSLRFGRAEQTRRSHHGPAAIVEAAVEALAPRLREQRGALRVEIAPDLPRVYADDGQIVQVLVILVSNALDVVGSADRVLIRVVHCQIDLADRRGQRTVSGARFEVVDDGSGIPAHLMGRIFDPFFTTKANGTGLGLSIAQKLVTENRGRIEVSSTRGQGTIFAVSLPENGR